MLTKKIFRRGSALLLTAALLISLFVLSSSAVEPDGINTDGAQAIYLYNIENDKVLYEKNINDMIQPVSTVKIMAGLIAAEALADRLDEVIVVTEAMISGVVGQHYNIMPGHNLSVRDLLYLAFCGGCHGGCCGSAEIECKSRTDPGDSEYVPEYGGTTGDL